MARKKKTTKKKTTKKKTSKSGPTRKKATNKTRMSAAELRKFQRLLLEKRVEIFGDVNSMKEESLKRQRSDLSNVPFHMADVGSDNYDLENTLGLMDEEVKLLTEIDDALQRIEDKTYGICEGSDKPIPKARLEAIPWARYCVEYKEKLEKGLVDLPEEKEKSRKNAEDEDFDFEDAEDLDEQEDEDEEDEDEIEDPMEQLDKHLAMMGDDEGDDEEETP